MTIHRRQVTHWNQRERMAPFSALRNSWQPLIGPLSHPRPLSRKPPPSSEFGLMSGLTAVEPGPLVRKAGFTARWTEFVNTGRLGLLRTYGDCWFVLHLEACSPAAARSIRNSPSCAQWRRNHSAVLSSISRVALPFHQVPLIKEKRHAIRSLRCHGTNLGK